MSDRFADRLNAWRTPLVILVCGCLIGMIGFGPRSTFGFFLSPMTAANGWVMMPKSAIH